MCWSWLQEDPGLSSKQEQSSTGGNSIIRTDFLTKSKCSGKKCRQWRLLKGAQSRHSMLGTIRVRTDVTTERSSEWNHFVPTGPKSSLSSYADLCRDWSR